MPRKQQTRPLSSGSQTSEVRVPRAVLPREAQATPVLQLQALVLGAFVASWPRDSTPCLSSCVWSPEYLHPVLPLNGGTPGLTHCSKFHLQSPSSKTVLSRGSGRHECCGDTTWPHTVGLAVGSLNRTAWITAVSWAAPSRLYPKRGRCLQPRRRTVSVSQRDVAYRAPAVSVPSLELSRATCPQGSGL